MVRRTRAGIGLVLAGALASWLLASTALGASTVRPTVEVLGFRASGSRLVEPGGTIERACNPRRLVASVAIKGARKGALLQRRWRLNGKLVKAASAPWKWGSKRRIVHFQILNPDTLPRGRYQIAVRVSGARWKVASVRLACG